MTCTERQSGFTLLELLVAMGIFAVVGAMALGGLNAVVGQGSQTQAQMERLAKLQRAVRLIVTDIGSVEPRFVRDELGTSDTPEGLPLLADGRGDYLIRLTRGGWPNPAGLPSRGTLQRVQYRLEDGKVFREYWPVVDRVLGQEPRSEELLAGVNEMTLQFLDSEKSADEWQRQWPPLSSAGQKSGGRLRAVRVTLDLEDWGKIERLIEVPQ